MEGNDVSIHPAPPSKTTAALLLALLAGLAAGPAPAALTDPAQITTEAYVNLVQGDQSLDAGRLEESLALYKTARDYYLQLSRDFPDWEPRVIQYRLTYCENQIIDVERRLTQGGPQVPPPAAPPATEPPAPAAAPQPAGPGAAEPSVEIDYLKSRIASLETELAEFDTLQEEWEALSAAHARLQQELVAANQRLDAAAGQDQTALAELRAELAAKDEQIRTLQADAEVARQREQAIRELEAKVGELTVRNERLQQEVTTLDEELDDAEQRADQAEEQLRLATSRAHQAQADLEPARAAQDTARPDPAPFATRAPQASPPMPAPDVAAPKALPEQQPEAAAAVSPAPSPATAAPLPVPDHLSPAEFIRQLLKDGRNDVALATVRQARQPAPDDMNLTLLEGVALIRLQRYAEAAAMLVELARHNPKNAEIHATLGAAMMGAGFYEEARETLQMAIKLDKQLPECLYNLAQLHTFIDPIDLKAARRFYKQALNLGLAVDPQLEAVLK